MRFFAICIVATSVACVSCGEQPTGNWVLAPWTKVDSVNPILGPLDESVFRCPVRDTLIRWEQKDVFNPAAVVFDDRVYLIYRAEDTVGIHAGTSRIGLASSVDGLHFERFPEPVLFPDRDEWRAYEWEGGCEDPRVVRDEQGVFFMTYTAYDGETARLLVASSSNLREWTKHGSVFERAANREWKDRWSKSGSVVTRMVNGTPVATRVGGKYWMYFGDTDIFAATSDNLIEWEPLLDAEGNFLPVLSPRPEKFDSNLVEPGPPALLTEEGIILIYNSRNGGDQPDPSLPVGTYAAGQALFSADDPADLLQRTADSFMKPDKPYELEGQVNKVCFLEGMVFYQNQWFIYYGTADSRIAVAVYTPE